MKQRLTLTIHGVVQGINLRSMIKVQALALGLSGYVMNQPDGTVLVEAEGEKEKMEELMKWLNTKPGNCQIYRMEDIWNEATDQYDDFVTKY